MQRELGVESLLLCIERSQLKWFWHPVRTPSDCLPLEGVLRPTGRKPQGRPRTCWRNSISLLAWECLGIPQEELQSVAGERDAQVSLLKLLLHVQTLEKRMTMDGQFVQTSF